MAGQMLDELAEAVQETIRELREFAHGIYPPLLVDSGLGEALKAVVNRSPLDVELDHRGHQSLRRRRRGRGLLLLSRGTPERRQARAVVHVAFAYGKSREVCSSKCATTVRALTFAPHNAVTGTST